MNGLTAWERWELASLDAETPVASNEEGASAIADGKELAQTRDEARREGYDAGYAAGQAAAQAEA
jgi:hypothetical protein